MKRFALLLSALVLVIGLSGCGSSNANGEGAKVVGDATATAPASGAAAGTRENPLAIGTTAVVGEWEITVTKVNLDAWKLIKKANMFNDAPEKGSKYVMVSVKAKFVGEDSGTLWTDASYKFLGSGGNTFDSASVVTPKAIMEAGETFPGASVVADLPFEVPTDQIDGGAIILEESFSADSSRTFWAVK